MLTQPWVYYIKAFANLTADQELVYLQQFTEEKSARIQRLAFAEDRTRSILGLALLRLLLKQQLNANLDFKNIKHPENAKPYIQEQFNVAKIDFSITHSGNCIACAAYSDCLLGLDTEALQNKPHKLSDRFMNQAEMDYIGDNELRFLEIWTKKEALIKADPDGKLMQLKAIDIMSLHNKGVINQREYFLQHLALSKDTVTHIACNKSLEKTNTILINAEELIQHDLNL